eukprot:TRINITY_DN3265_c0_g1_i2.p1 TRINITY_DN3265_c0_g1~~TRINITY_DN3265_c0_g1_i2.p1  ORF type:complete len:288 (-),score=37.55 TRINITY_DN3265_c0_g1_i2:732-1595(-)
MADQENSPLLIEEPVEDDFSKWDGKRTYILIIITFASFVGPISSSMYFPALPTVMEEFEVSEFLVTLTVSSFWILAGSSPLIWGPLSDRYGRKKFILIGMLFHIGTTIGCALAWDIYSLIIFRAVQALGIGALMVIGSGIIADIYRPAIRGDALGWYTLAPSVGPLFGPILGGVISQNLGWRWIFGILSITMGVMAIIVLIFLPETLNYSTRPEKLNILGPLKLLFSPLIGIMSIANGVVVSVVAATLVLFPIALEENFGLDATSTGLSYIPYGVLALVGMTELIVI